MKIGIFTLHGTTNYGGALQAYALSQTLKQMGHAPEIVRYNYCSEVIGKARRIIGILTTYTFKNLLFLIKGLIKRTVNRPYNSNRIDKRREKFDKFYRDDLTYTESLLAKDLPDFVMRYDALITGSDQVWTDLYTYNLIYFFNTMDAFKGRRISYAACSAHTKVPVYNRTLIKNLLKRFDAISVRDETTAQLVEKVSGLMPTIVGDPTLLYDFGDFSEMVTINEPYIFCYFLGAAPPEGHDYAIKKIKTSLGNMKVVAVTDQGSKIALFADVVIEDASPWEWVELLANSSFVYTDSFHAVLFSLKYQKSFMACYNEVIRASRLLSLKKAFSLNNRITNKLEQVNLEKDIEWAAIDIQLDTIKATSINFLKTALKQEQK